MKKTIINLIIRLKNRFLGIDPRSQLEIAVSNGLSIGKDCAIMGEVIIDPGHCWLIYIGNNVTIAPRCHILAHDASTKRTLGYAVIGPVIIGDDSFIGANSIILPGSEIGKNCIIGAGSVVKHSIPDGSVAVGNPAKVICSTEDYFKKRKLQMKNRPVYDATYKIHNITEAKKEEMKAALKVGIGFVE